MPDFGKRQNKTGVKCRTSANAKAKQVLNAELQQTPKQNRC
ncbi:adenylate kinase [Prevotella sp. oral taxon 820]|nr:adenylate kinase [Prevotella sp. oral taxon 820]